MGKTNDILLSFRVKVLEEEVKKLKDLVKELMKERKQHAAEQKEEEQIINIHEALKLLKLPRHIMYAKINAGEIPSFRVGKLYKFKRSELLDWMENEKLSVGFDVDEYVNKYLQNNFRNK
jgi:excisionase family DNA binding protein